MKIVHIEDFFHPSAGYQVNVLAKYMSKNGHDVFIITSEMEKIPDGLKHFFGDQNIVELDKEYEKKYSVRIIRVPLLTYKSGRSIYKCRKIWSLLEEINPDLIYVHGNDTYIAIRVFLRNNRLKGTIISDSHMVDIASTNRFRDAFRLIYRNTITPIIIRKKIKVIRLSEDGYIWNHFRIPLRQAPVVSFGTDTLLFKQNKDSKEKYREDHNLPKNAFVVLYAGKINKEKGGELLANLTCADFSDCRPIVFIIIGNTVGEYGEKVEELFNSSKNTIIRYSTQPYEELASLYQVADVAVIPAQCSLSIFDFAACGLPIIAEDNEINQERIESLEEGTCFKSGNIEELSKAIKKYAKMEKKELEKKQKNIASKANAKFGYEIQYKKYMEIIESAMKDHNK